MNVNRAIIYIQTRGAGMLLLLMILIVMALTGCGNKAVDRDEFIDKKIYSEEIKGVAYKAEPPPTPGSGILLRFLKYIAYGLLAVAGVALIYFLLFEEKLLRLPKKGAKRKAMPDLNYNSDEELETVLDNAALQKLLEEALLDGHFQLAVRIRFVLLIRMLNDAGALEYRIDKSNRDYLTEMSGNRYRGFFKHIVRIYELIWFGEINITQQDYLSVSGRFDWLMQKFQHHEN